MRMHKKAPALLHKYSYTYGVYDRLPLCASQYAF